MKYALVLFLITASCATGVIKADWTKAIVGKSGFIREPVQIVKDDKKKWAPFAEFKRCEPVEVVEARAYGKNTGIVVRQAGKLFYVWSAHDFVNEFKDKPSPEMLNEYLAPTLDEALGEKKTVKLTTGTFDSHQLQCQSTYFPGMTKRQLIFVKGHPTQVKGDGAKEQWLYSQKDNEQSFDFENGLLARWQD